MITTSSQRGIRFRAAGATDWAAGGEAGPVTGCPQFAQN